MKNSNQPTGFICYSVPLMKFLTEKKGIDHIAMGLHHLSKDTFWVFVQNKDLSLALREWKDTKPIIKS